MAVKGKALRRATARSPPSQSKQAPSRPLRWASSGRGDEETNGPVDPASGIQPARRSGIVWRLGNGVAPTPGPIGCERLTDDPLDLSALRAALASLEDALAVVADEPWFGGQAAGVRNTLVAGVIQNFEFVYEISVKMIRRSLERDSANSREVDEMSFRDLLRHAGERGLIADVAAWLTYRAMRNTTAHAYDHDKAMQIYRRTPAFATDARALLARLNDRHG